MTNKKSGAMMPEQDPERPAPFVITRQHVWIACEDDDGPKGIAIKVRRDLTNRERDDLNDHYREHIAAYQREWASFETEKLAQADADHDTPRDREWTLLAPYVLAWNVRGLNGDGEEVDVPAPADGGPDVFELVTKDAIDWILHVVLNGYRATGKANGLKGV